MGFSNIIRTHYTKSKKSNYISSRYATLRKQDRRTSLFTLSKSFVSQATLHLFSQHATNAQHLKFL